MRKNPYLFKLKIERNKMKLFCGVRIVCVSTCLSNECFSLSEHCRFTYYSSNMAATDTRAGFILFSRTPYVPFAVRWVCVSAVTVAVCCECGWMMHECECCKEWIVGVAVVSVSVTAVARNFYFVFRSLTSKYENCTIWTRATANWHRMNDISKLMRERFWNLLNKFIGKTAFLLCILFLSTIFENKFKRTQRTFCSV